MLSIIIADDHELFRKGLELTLNGIEHVFKVRHAENGQQVIDLMQEAIADIVFMDIRMPVMDGIQATSLTKKKYPLTKVIAISTLDDRENIINMFRAGASAYLLKNTNKKEIEVAMNTVLKGEKYYTHEISSILVEKIFETEKPEKISKIKIDLTDRELEVLKLICQQFSSKEISEILEITERTVQNHRANILSKTNCRNTAGLVLLAIETGIIIPS